MSVARRSLQLLFGFLLLTSACAPPQPALRAGRPGPGEDVTDAETSEGPLPDDGASVPPLPGRSDARPAVEHGDAGAPDATPTTREDAGVSQPELRQDAAVIVAPRLDAAVLAMPDSAPPDTTVTLPPPRLDGGIDTAPAPVTPGKRLASEGFDDRLGALHGAGLGQGLAWSWAVQNASVAVPGLNVVSDQPLTHAAVSGSQRHMVGGISYLAAGRHFDRRQSSPFSEYLDSAGRIGKPGTRLWVGALVRVDRSNVDGSFLSLHAASGPPWNPGPDEGFPISFGLLRSGTDEPADPHWSLRVGGQTAVSAKSAVRGQTTWLVVELDFAQPSSARLYVNPSERPLVPDAELTGISARPAFTSVALYPGSSPDTSAFDELRVATTYEALRGP